MYKKLNVVMVTAAASLLAALGLWLCWVFPVEATWGGWHPPLFTRQLCGNVLGAMAFAGAWALGWKRWLKAAPWLMLGWLVLLAVAMSGPLINGSHRWIAIHGLRINVRTLLWPLGALFAGWVVSHRRIRPWMVYGVLACGFVGFLAWMFLDASRGARLLAFCGGQAIPQPMAYMQLQMRTALEAAKWFGAAGMSLACLPNPHTDSVVAGVSLLLGKWTVVAAVVLIGVIAAGLAGWRRQLSDPSRRMCLEVFGLVLIAAAGWNFLQNLMLAPVFGCTFSLLGYGGTDVLCAWLGLGIAASAACEVEESRSEVRRQWLPWTICMVAAGALASALWWAPVPQGRRFGEPRPSRTDFGEFGTQPVRGTILASDGSVLAKSVGEWDVHVDPRDVCHGESLSSNDVVEAVSQGLGLSREATRKIYANASSRYVLAKINVDAETLEWCRARGHAKRYGLVLERMQRRCYPLGKDAAAVTGRCIVDPQSGFRLNGVFGLEYTCNKYLTGVPGKVDDCNQTLAENLRTGMPTNGGVVRTTIDVSIQRELAGILRDAAASNHAESAWALAVRIPKGEIAAMCSCPVFDPNVQNNFFNGRHDLINGAVQLLQEPGGLMKPLVYALAVEAGHAKPDEIGDFGNATFTNLCHILGTNVLWRGLSKFQVGNKLGGGLLYGEEARPASPPRCWVPVMLESFGIGQGLMMTGVQLAQAYATLANGGARVTPYLVDSISDVAGKTVWTPPAKPEERWVGPATAAAVTKFLLMPTNAVAHIAGGTVAGKTSTFAMVESCPSDQCNHYSTTNFNALVAGYFPAARPEYALVVGFRKPHPEHQAEQVALPAFEKMVQAIMLKKTVPNQ